MPIPTNIVESYFTCARDLHCSTSALLLAQVWLH